MSTLDHRLVLGSISKSSGDGRFAAFRENPCEETARAISDACYKNLMGLVKGGKKAKKASKEEAAPKKTKKSKSEDAPKKKKKSKK